MIAARKVYHMFHTRHRQKAYYSDSWGAGPLGTKQKGFRMLLPAQSGWLETCTSDVLNV